MKRFSMYMSIVFVLIIHFQSITLLACECDFPSVCVAYSKAKKVFIGKLIKVVKDEAANYYTINAHFLVEKSYKGATSGSEIVTFKLGGCSSIDFIEGEKYFVYAEESNINTYCNRTVSLARAKFELDYVNNLSEKKPIYSIKGTILGLTESDRENIKITIRDNKKNNKISIDKNSMFNFTAIRKGQYRINIVIPFKAQVEVKNNFSILPDKVTTTSSTTIIDYYLNFKPNECDFREVSIIKR